MCHSPDKHHPMYCVGKSAMQLALSEKKEKTKRQQVTASEAADARPRRLS